MGDKPKEEIKRAMVVVAHADDAEFVCSGTVAKWCSEGVDVVYVICNLVFVIHNLGLLFVICDM